MGSRAQLITFDYAVRENARRMSWPLTLGMEEAEKYAAQRKEAIAKADTPYAGKFVMMRHTAVYETEVDRQAALKAVQHNLGQFGNLMMKKGAVNNGFPDVIPFGQLAGNVRVEPAMLEQNLMFGSVEQVIEKLKAYKALGLDGFIYYASMGLEPRGTAAIVGELY